MLRVAKKHGYMSREVAMVSHVCLLLVDENTSFTKQEKLLLKFDSILAALGVCDQVILKIRIAKKINCFAIFCSL